jgi:hypothetical protein
MSCVAGTAPDLLTLSLNGGILAVNSDLNLRAGPPSSMAGPLEALGSGRGIFQANPWALPRPEELSLLPRGPPRR